MESNELSKDKYINTKTAKEKLGVTVKTLRLWDKEGKVRTIRMPSGHRRYNFEDVQKYFNVHVTSEQKKKLCYCRVSSSKQVDDLERQKDFFRSQFPSHELVTDVGSGINWKRKGLRAILDRAMHDRDISEIVVAHRDRLCRFAFDLLEWIFNRLGVSLVVLDQTKDESGSSELADDILSIIHVYSCRQMGSRRYKNKKDKNSSDDATENYAETMDGDQEICLQ